MSAFCDCDSDYYVELLDWPELSVGTETCVECKELIHVGVSHYYVRKWGFDDFGDECEKGQRRCCEQCGELAISFLDLGCCWTFGDLRYDISELNTL